MSKSSDPQIDQLIADSEAAIKRLESLQKDKGTAGQKIATHVKKQGSHITNVVLAGGLLVVAFLRLNDKWRHQAEVSAWEEEKSAMQTDLASLQDRLSHCSRTVEDIAQVVKKERIKSASLNTVLGSFAASTSLASSNDASMQQSGQQQLETKQVSRGGKFMI